MTKDDKQYFKGLFKGLEGRFDNLEGRFDNFEGRFDKLEDQVGRNYEAIQKNSGLIQKNSDEIRHLGVRFEKMQSDIDLILEGNSSFHSRISRLEKAVL